jgi:hypothetical protein
MNENIITSRIGKKLIHPKVFKVLQRLACLSPTAVPRDPHQPKEGCLAQMKLSQNSCKTQVLQEEVKKPNTILNMSSSLLHRRKLSMSIS